MKLKILNFSGGSGAIEFVVVVFDSLGLVEDSALVVDDCVLVVVSSAVPFLLSAKLKFF